MEKREKSDDLSIKNTTIDNKISENYDYDDETYVWKIFSHKPSKFSIHSKFDITSFSSLLEGVESRNQITSSNVVVGDKSAYYTNKILVLIEEHIFISFYENIETDLELGEEKDSYITKCTFYYNSKFISLDYLNENYVNQFSACITPINEEESNLSYLVYIDNKLELEPVKNNINFEKEDSVFYDSFKTDTRHKISDIMKSLEDNNNATYYLYGTRYSDKKELYKDKESVIGHIIHKSNKNFIIIPSNIFEVFLTSLGLTELFRTNPDTIFIVDGAENLIYDEKILKGLDEIVKGLMANFIPCKFLFSFNTMTESDIPKYLKEHAEMYIKFGGTIKGSSSYF